jgi:hypothetical protein
MRNELRRVMLFQYSSFSIAHKHRQCSCLFMNSWTHCKERLQNTKTGAASCKTGNTLGNALKQQVPGCTFFLQTHQVPLQVKVKYRLYGTDDHNRPRERVVLGTLTAPQLVKMSHEFQETQKFITFLKKSLPIVPILNQSNPLHVPIPFLDLHNPKLKIDRQIFV